MREVCNDVFAINKINERKMMKLKIFWNKPITMTKVSEDGLSHDISFNKIPSSPGVYIFARYWGHKYEALYVGKSENMRSRIKGHLNNLSLMKHLKSAKVGKRVIITGRALIQPGQKLGKVLKILERALIRHFLAEGHDLANQHGASIRRHEIFSDGPIKKSFVPSSIYLEKRKGE